jgi:predicted P-loop ATPase
MMLQRSWIVTSDEAHTLRKAEAEAQKEFLTRTHDVFRAPYDRAMAEYPRHCVIWGTTNDDIFLANQEGNRRFLVIRVEEALDFDRMSDEYVDQVWAEAVHLYQQGERIWLTPEETELVRANVAIHVEEDSLVGVLQAWLDGETDSDDFRDEDAPEERRDVTCSRELFARAVNPMKAPDQKDLRDVTRAMAKLPDWRLTPKSHRAPGGYGPQKLFVRVGSDAEEKYSKDWQ